jgi:hypothetical protein
MFAHLALSYYITASHFIIIGSFCSISGLRGPHSAVLAYHPYQGGGHPAIYLPTFAVWIVGKLSNAEYRERIGCPTYKNSVPRHSLLTQPDIPWSLI